MQTVPTRSYSITLPQYSLSGVPREYRREQARIRSEISDAEITARTELRSADRYKSDWSSDLDPSPQRVHRTSDSYGEQRMIAVETTDEPGPYQQPSKMVKEKEGRHKTTAFFEDGQVVRLEQVLHGHDGGVENMTIEVNNDTNTVTYTINETGEFALSSIDFPVDSSEGGAVSGPEPRPSGSGPDDVYDEWDNSRGGSGPDHIYNEWDNGRGYYFDGPDGRTSYDPYH